MTALVLTTILLFNVALLLCERCPIRPQIQPTSKSCVSACLAMLLNRPAAEVVKEFHDNYMSGHRDVEWYLTQQGLKVTKMFTTDDSEKEGGFVFTLCPLLKYRSCYPLHYFRLAKPRGGLRYPRSERGKTGSEKLRLQVA